MHYNMVNPSVGDTAMYRPFNNEVLYPPSMYNDRYLKPVNDMLSPGPRIYSTPYINVGMIIHPFKNPSRNVLYLR